MCTAQALIEICAAQMDTRRGQDVRATIGFLCALRPQPDNREIRGSPSDINDKHSSFTIHALLVIQSSSDWLQLERYIPKTRIFRSFAQRIFGQSVALRIAVNEMNRSPKHYSGGFAPHYRPSSIGQQLQKQGNDLLVTHQSPVDRSFLLKQSASQQAFQRPHQTPFRPRQVMGNGLPPCVGAPVFCIEEQSGRQRGKGSFHWNHLSPTLKLSHSHC